MDNPEASGWTKLPRVKKLLVLDLDGTLCDFASTNYERIKGPDIARPYLHQFLKTANKYYQIVVWSATNQSALNAKLGALNMVLNDNYKILFTLNEDDMVKTATISGVVNVKPLSVIWRKFSDFNSSNTLIVDDYPSNFYLNPRNGLHIKPYYRTLYRTDNELDLLTKYVVLIAKYSSHFETMNHKKWREYVAKNQ